ncbi:serine/threonine protein kinase [Yinghuangia seranimata]|uniref:serine/threonine protein kinase n=1 Tax=Yinghuangia seranimata TaxID=408067 RepID=UPI00248CF5DA|nr:serine/threonine-protein kinase [Yinghuangia seranimata]MDI2128341.1 protein kinase [Yinghuangia seranimata]
MHTVLNARYRLVGRLGGGAMGDVWLGEDTVLERRVAVKLLKPHLLDNAAFAVRFRREARMMAKLSHPGIVSIHDFGNAEFAGAPISYLVMELVDGEPLSDVLRRRRTLSADETLRIARQVLEALAVAHRAGIIHRDIKPSNLMVRQDRVLVADFGLALPQDDPRLTESGVLMGTALYQAPEVASSGATTPSVDLYAVGVVMYECLTGEVPFTGTTSFDVILRHITEPAPALPNDIPAPVRALVARALTKEPEERWADADAMAEDVRAVLEALDAPDDVAAPAAVPAAAEAADTVPMSGRRRAGGRRPRKTRRRVLLAIAAAVVVMAATIAVIVSDGSSADSSHKSANDGTAQGHPPVPSTALTPAAPGPSASPTPTPSPSAKGTTTTSAPATRSAAASPTASSGSATPAPVSAAANQLAPGTYHFTTTNGATLDNSFGRNKDGNDVITWSPNSSDAQLWQMVRPDGTDRPGYLLASVPTGGQRWLDVDGPSQTVQVWGGAWRPDQLWTFVPVAGGYQIVNAATSSCLTDSGRASRTVVRQCAPGDASQVWSAR